MKIKAASYARFSSDLQKDASIEDQFRICGNHAKAHNLQIITQYADRGISGASMLQRPKLLKMISDARNGKFEVLVVEAIDRLSRNQRDIADIYQNLTYANVPILSVSEGEINELHIGLKGTMNALFLKDLKIKVKRGQVGRLKAGRAPAGICYGYDKVPGEENGVRQINRKQADIVQRIYTMYAEGHSCRTIAKALNADNIPSPRGGEWQDSTINGNRKRASGILENPIYVGEILYNRQSFVKDPQTGRYRGRDNPESEWERGDAPELAIIPRDLWERVRARKKQASGTKIVSRRPKYLISGILKCEECGGPYTAMRKNSYGCSHRKNRGTCSNGLRVNGSDAQSRILRALKAHLKDPEYIQVFIAEYRAEWDRLSDNRFEKKQQMIEKKKTCEHKIENLLEVVESGSMSAAIAKQLAHREAELSDINTQIANIPDLEPIPMPNNLAEKWGRRLNNLDKYLEQEDIEPASQLLKSIVQEVVVSPKRNKEYELKIAAIDGGGRSLARTSLTPEFPE